MSQVGTRLPDRLRAWGTSHVYGASAEAAEAVPGGSETGDGPRFVRARHAGTAALMASGHARFTATAGCCLAGSAAEAVRLLDGLCDARADRVPVVALWCPPEAPAGEDASLVLALLDRVALHQEVLTNPGQLDEVIDRAFRAALSGRGVAVAVLPRDILARATGPSAAGAATETPVQDRARTRPDDGELSRAADVLNAGKRLVVVVGTDAADASGAIVGVSELLGAGIGKTLAAKDVLPDDLAQVDGPVDVYPSGAVRSMLRDCDTVLSVGGGLVAGPWLPSADRARRVHISPGGEAAEPGDVVRLTGDPRTALDALIPLLVRTADRSWRGQVEKDIGRWRADCRKAARRHFGRAVNPRAVAHELAARLPDRAIVTADRGTSTAWWAHHVMLRNGMSAATSATREAPGSALPFALAARLAHPDRPVVALVGDGAFQMNGFAELTTALEEARYLLAAAPFVICVFNNGGLGQTPGAPPGRPGAAPVPDRAVPDVPYAAFAKLIGLEGILCETPKDVGSAWDAALSRAKPVVLEFRTDAGIPAALAGDGEPTGLLRRLREGARGERAPG